MRTPSRCGRMDQCVVMGPAAVGLMQFDGARCSLTKLKLDCKRKCESESKSKSDSSMGSNCAQRASLYFVVVDLKAAKDTVVILRDLNACFPFAADSTQVSFEFNKGWVILGNSFVVKCFSYRLY